ncbi:nuclear valosin-containing protein-like [Teleopsis dalmanni]|uniref:nuclear valosin-containing protein-like n=1 Tax=Teleopsis dalmanni TaxID=139649 RepID=UPI000D32BC60|nr:nuclear valosin-containing protein-like [Teleopsis dalmanni]
MKKNKPILYDPLIINRVRKYLEDNVDKTYLDVGVMTKDLQDQYIEYSRRKVGPFRTLVEQAYRIVSESYGLDERGFESGDSGSDLEMMEESASTKKNLMGDMLNQLYAKNKNPTNAKDSAEGEAIDISSDESSDEAPTNGKNGKSQMKLAKCLKSSDSTVNNELNSERPLAQKHGKAENSTQPAKKQKMDADFLANKQSSQNECQLYQILAMQQKARKYKKDVQLHKSREDFNDIGGMEKNLKELCEVLLHLKTPDVYYALGLVPPRGILLHGPTGCGKTLLAHAIAGQLNLYMITVPATELISGISGESEEMIRNVFEQARICSPCVLFIDEIDAICGNRSNAQKAMEHRVVLQLISCLDELKQTINGQSVLVIAATSRPNELDPALRRVGRFDHEVAIEIPNRRDRKEILSIICEGISLEAKCDFDKIAELTPGYVGGDLLALVSRAATIAVKKKCSEQMRKFREREQENITFVDLDDEENEETDKANKSGKEDKTNDLVTNNNEAKNSDEKTTTEEETLEKEKNGSESKDSENKKTDAVEESAVDKMEIDEEQAKEEETIDAESNELKLQKENDDDAKKQCVKKENIPEPSLFEMINWLENPPEEIMVVDKFYITLDDFLDAIKLTKPSAKREGFITVPDVTWEDIGSLQEIRDELKLAILAPVKFPEKLEILGLSAPSGVLLCGPPGCGKTLLAKAIANEAGINFISVKGPELMNMYVGESERAVRACFQRARNSAPCVIFFDEFDSLCPKRSDSNESGSGTRIVNQLLTEMDGVEDRQGVYILAATNRPDIIDPAILRPGRLDTILYVGLPKENDRAEILKATTKNRTRPLLSEEVDFVELAKKTDGFTGADLAGLMRQAAMLVLKDGLNSDFKEENMCVGNKHIEAALKMLRPSITEKDRKIYENLRFKYAAPRVPDLINN